MKKQVWWLVGGLAALALLTLWIIDKSPMDESFKSVAKRTVATGSALAVVAAIAAAAVMGLPAPFGLVAAGAVLVGSGAWAFTRNAVSGAFSGTVCPPGATPIMSDGELWCSCQTTDGSVALFRAGTEPDTPCATV